MHIYGKISLKDSYYLLDYAIDKNINFFDTSTLYGDGYVEEILGKKCLGAYTSTQQKRFMWQGKCDISDETLERVKNYKKSE